MGRTTISYDEITEKKLERLLKELPWHNTSSLITELIHRGWKDSFEERLKRIGKEENK